MEARVAVVTGANKGIGLSIVKMMCSQFDGDVILTSRDVTRGQEAISGLKKQGLDSKYHQLDLADAGSITRLADFLKATYGGLDVLINNAGIAYKGSSTAPFAEQAEVTMQTNYFGTLNVCKALFPLLRPHARVVNVASTSGHLRILRSKDLVGQFTSPKLTEAACSGLMQQFVDDVKAGKRDEIGWPTTAYGTTKLGVIALTHVQASVFAADPREDIVVNACCPGYVKTDMTSYAPNANKLPDEGADTPVYLALLPPNIKSPVGEFVYDRVVHKW